MKMNTCSESEIPNTYRGNVYTRMKDTGKCGRSNDNTLPQMIEWVKKAILLIRAIIGRCRRNNDNTLPQYTRMDDEGNIVI